ncbi:BLUF domain-containing protein [Adhaeribacter radiodurans]|uniref:BLUF domain-containing protein n=1 Tax=Adhaeribacter radiodurans TaxID=2745197 RepID=A0A7L7L617_9BACT|nr:BLUF domain-containing protein [Adhaeribacter radiodurans]QMU27819.1 BLUF domain-containing protein [Adhaeribacter radiodurans]
MYYTVYLSTAAQLMSDEELKKILLVSNANNRDLGVTGMLLYHEGSIVQVIEGEEQTIKKLYAKIANDPRHRGIIKLSEGKLDQRNFPEWSMGFRTVSAPEFAQVTGYQNVNDKSLLKPSPDQPDHNVLIILRTFYHTNIVRF